MIGLFLLAMCALPLCQIPTQALKRAYKSSYSIQAKRIADLAFAKILEQLYQNKIPWKELSSGKDKSAVVLNDTVDIFFNPQSKAKDTFKFVLLGTLYSTGKKASDGQQWRLVTFRLTITPEQKGFKPFAGKKTWADSRVYTYQVIVSKTGPPAIREI